MTIPTPETHQELHSLYLLLWHMVNTDKAYDVQTIASHLDTTATQELINLSNVIFHNDVHEIVLNVLDQSEQAPAMAKLARNHATLWAALNLRLGLD